MSNPTAEPADPGTVWHAPPQAGQARGLGALAYRLWRLRRTGVVASLVLAGGALALGASPAAAVILSAILATIALGAFPTKPMEMLAILAAFAIAAMAMGLGGVAESNAMLAGLGVLGIGTLLFMAMLCFLGAAFAIRWPGRMRVETSIHIAAPPETVFRAMALSEEGDSVDGRVVSIARDPNDPAVFHKETLHNLFDAATGKLGATRVPATERVVATEPGRSQVVTEIADLDTLVDEALRPDGEPRLMGASAAWELRPERAGTRVTMVEEAFEMPAIAVIGFWLEDVLGDQLSHYKARIEGSPDPSIRAMREQRLVLDRLAALGPSPGPEGGGPGNR